MALSPFQRFLDQNRDVVYRFLVAVAGRQEAEDCFQETFLAALAAYPRLRDASNLRGWVMQIAYRKAMDAHRGRRRRPEPVGDVPEGPAHTDDGHDPEMWKLVDRLPAKQREAVVLRYVGDLAYREVAGAMGGTEAAARQNVRMGLAKLREEWGT